MVCERISVLLLGCAPRFIILATEDDRGAKKAGEGIGRLLARLSRNGLTHFWPKHVQAFREACECTEIVMRCSAALRPEFVSIKCPGVHTIGRLGHTMVNTFNPTCRPPPRKAPKNLKAAQRQEIIFWKFLSESLQIRVDWGSFRQKPAQMGLRMGNVGGRQEGVGVCHLLGQVWYGGGAVQLMSWEKNEVDFTCTSQSPPCSSQRKRCWRCKIRFLG